MATFLSTTIFYGLALVIIGSALFTAFSKNLVHAAFSLLFTFFGLACMYLYLGADFVGLAQIIIYVGGILVLLLFGVMFTHDVAGGVAKQTINMKWGIIFLLLLLVVFIPLIYVTPWPTIQDGAEKVTTSTIVPIGNLLLSKYLLPFEIASLLLLIALIGAVVIARGEVKLKEVEDEKSKQS